MATLKVYGFTTRNPEPENGFGPQVRVIIAAHSVAELTRKTRITRREYEFSGGVTNNAAECVTAEQTPGTPFYRRLHSNPAGQDVWRTWPVEDEEPVAERPGIECPLCAGTGTTPRSAYRYGLGR